MSLTWCIQDAKKLLYIQGKLLIIVISAGIPILTSKKTLENLYSLALDKERQLDRQRPFRRKSTWEKPSKLCATGENMIVLPIIKGLCYLLIIKLKSLIKV